MNIGNQHTQDGTSLDGEDKWTRFFLTFEYEGREYALDFFAPNLSHAEKMVEALKDTAQYKGYFDD